MKKSIFVILAVFLMYEAFPQSVNAGDIRFENRKKTGYYNITQIGLFMGNQPYSERNPNYYDDRSDFQISPSITMINGGMFNEHWAAGVGVGFEIFDRNLFPVFMDIRRTLWDNRVSPFFAFKMGYAFSGFRKKHYDYLSLPYEPYNINDAFFKKDGGLMLNPEMGVKVPLSENADMLFTVAYRYQKTKSTASQDFGQQTTWQHQVSMNRLSFSIAVMFR